MRFCVSGTEAALRTWLPSVQAAVIRLLIEGGKLNAVPESKSG